MSVLRDAALGASALLLLGGCGGGVEAAGLGEPGGRARDIEEDLDLGLPTERTPPPLPALPTLTARHGAPETTNGAATDGDARSQPRDTTVAQDPGSDATPDAAPPNAALSQRIRAVIGRGVAEARKASKGRVDGRNATVAVHVRAIAPETELVAVSAASPLIPASNLKLLTVAAALALWGVDAAFETTFDVAPDADRARSGGVLRGDLVARAGGDPLYQLDAGGSIEAWLDVLATELRAAGITRVEGHLVLDDTGWEAPGVPEGWPSASDHWQAYCAKSGGFTANAGCLTATVTPTRAGSNADVVLHPLECGLDRRISVKTGAARSGNDVRVGATVSAAVVRGSLGQGDPVCEVDFAHPDPRDLFGSAVVGGLARRGIAITEGHALSGPDAGARGTLVARVRTPITTTFVPILCDSNNSVADQLFFATAHAASGRGERVAGQAALRAALERLGVDAQGLIALDGSGLSKVDRCTAAQLTGVLAALARGPREAFAPYYAALPIAGESGKLSGRMRGTAAQGKVRAKTGFVNGASSLSGFVDTRDGGRLAFSILVNYPPVSGLNNSAWKPMQDEICALLAEASVR